MLYVQVMAVATISIHSARFRQISSKRDMKGEQRKKSTQHFPVTETIRLEFAS